MPELRFFSALSSNHNVELCEPQSGRKCRRSMSPSFDCVATASAFFRSIFCFWRKITSGRYSVTVGSFHFRFSCFFFFFFCFWSSRNYELLARQITGCAAVVLTANVGAFVWKSRRGRCMSSSSRSGDTHTRKFSNENWNTVDLAYCGHPFSLITDAHDLQACINMEISLLAVGGGCIQFQLSMPCGVVVRWRTHTPKKDFFENGSNWVVKDWFAVTSLWCVVARGRSATGLDWPHQSRNCVVGFYDCGGRPSLAEPSSDRRRVSESSCPIRVAQTLSRPSRPTCSDLFLRAIQFYCPTWFYLIILR